jgi:hypothetical protein
MINVSQLTKDQRVKEIYQDINSKSINFMSFTPTQPIIEPSTMIQIIESIEDRVYFISESPAFEFNGKTYTCQQYKCDKVEDFKILMDNHSNEFYIVYNIILTTGVISNAPAYMIRGVFLEDPLIKRDQIINQILNEK